MELMAEQLHAKGGNNIKVLYIYIKLWKRTHLLRICRCAPVPQLHKIFTLASILREAKKAWETLVTERTGHTLLTVALSSVWMTLTVY